MFDEVLEKDKYPRATYQSSTVNAHKTGENTYRIDGELTLHGITRGMALDGQIVASEDTLRAQQGSLSLRQSDYGLKIASVAGGTLKLKDELKCSYFIVGSRV